MKKRHLLFALVLVLQMPSLKAASIGNDFDPTLKGLFVQLTQGNSEGLVGKTYTATLTIHMAKEQFLLFRDANVQSSDGMKYQFAKWEFTQAQITPFLSKRGSEVEVTFTVDAVEVTAPYESMPHVIATIDSIK